MITWRERVSGWRDEAVMVVIGLVSRLASKDVQRMMTRYITEGVERDMVELERRLLQDVTIDNRDGVN